MKLNTPKRKLLPFQQLFEDYVETAKFLKYQRFSYKQTPVSFKSLYHCDYHDEESELVFKYNGLIDFGISIDRILLFYGKPIIRNTYVRNSQVETLIYKNKLRGIKAKCSLTFYKGKLQIYTYVVENPSKKEHYKLNHDGFYKYGCKDLNCNERIIDRNGNSLILKTSSDEISFNFFAKNISQTSVFETQNMNNSIKSNSELAINNLL